MYVQGGNGANIEVLSTNFVRNIVRDLSGVNACFFIDTESLTYLQGQDKVVFYWWCNGRVATAPWPFVTVLTVTVLLKALQLLTVCFGKMKRYCRCVIQHCLPSSRPPCERCE